MTKKQTDVWAQALAVLEERQEMMAQCKRLKGLVRTLAETAVEDRARQRMQNLFSTPVNWGQTGTVTSVPTPFYGTVTSINQAS